MGKFLGILWLMVLSLGVQAQELNCKVQVVASKITTTDPKVFKTLETTIYEFLNNRKWTGDNFKPEERIDCSLIINITEDLGGNNYKATANIGLSRTGYNTSYNSPILNYADANFNFTYAEFQPVQFNDNVFNSNLASLLAYWSYILIGMDYDTYSLKGGTPHFSTALTILNNVPQSQANDQGTGWKPFDGNRNRAILLDEILKPRLEVVREVEYEYHRKGIDVMFENANTGRATILAALKKMERLAESDPNSMVLQLFFDAKRAELISMFTKAPPGERNEAYNVLVKLDGKKTEMYNQMKKG
jgi:hypothetical protein